MTPRTVSIDLGNGKEDISLGVLIRLGRMFTGPIGLRELSRRSGISAGQLSRIEAGGASRPTEATLRAIAAGLGRMPAPLLYLAGYIDDAQLVERAFEFTEQHADPSELIESFDLRDADAIVEMLWCTDVSKLDDALAELDPQVAAELREIHHAWLAITPERRRLVRAFVADQEVLSIQDRMPKPAGRYTFDVHLVSRNDG